MKVHINLKKKEELPTHNVKIETKELLEKYISQYKIGYIIRHFELSDVLIQDIANGHFSELKDEEFTVGEIEQFQRSLLSHKK